MAQPADSVRDSLERLDHALSHRLLVDLGDQRLPALLDLGRAAVIGALEDGKTDICISIRVGKLVIKLFSFHSSVPCVSSHVMITETRYYSRH